VSLTSLHCSKSVLDRALNGKGERGMAGGVSAASERGCPRTIGVGGEAAGGRALSPPRASACVSRADGRGGPKPERHLVQPHLDGERNDRQ